MSDLNQVQLDVIRADFRQGFELVFKALTSQEGKIRDLEMLVKELEERLAVMDARRVAERIRDDDTGREI